MQLQRVALAVGALLAAVCASAASRVGIVSEHTLAETWIPAPDAPRVVPGYPASASESTGDVCVNIGFMIEADGKTSNFAELRSWSSATPDAAPPAKLAQPFVQSAAAAVSMWRFVPTKGKARPVYTSASFAFDRSRTQAAEAIRAHCRIEDLAGLIAHARSEQARRRHAGRDGKESGLAGAERLQRHPDQRDALGR